VPDHFRIKAHVPTFNRNQTQRDVRRSVCPWCGQGIYGSEPTRFISRPVTGTVHERCAEEAEDSSHAA
jgi:hypothetical protein